MLQLLRGLCACVLPQAARSHATLAAEAQRARTIVVGDVHGCLLELQELLAKCSFSPERDAVVLVGDLVNKGPSSVEVVAYARTHGLHCVRGNHDEAALAQWEKRDAARRRGETPAAADKYAYTDEFSAEDVRFLRDMPYTLTLPHENAIVVHAGLVPGVRLDEQRPNDMTRMRNLLPKPKGGGWDAAEKGTGAPWAAEWPGPTHVIFGHDAKRRLQKCAHATGLDTGCCYGGELTALILPEHRLVSVAAKREYAPKMG